MLTFKCASCSKKIVTDDHLSGQQGECPYCRKTVVAPGTPRSDADKAGRDGPRCPKCGARRKDASPTCAFCGASIGPPKTRRMELPIAAEGLDRRKAMLLGALVVVALAVCAFIFMGGESAPDLPADELCRRQMLGMMNNVWSVPGGLPPSQGSQFWIDVAMKLNLQAAIKCPGATNKTRLCDYRGPAKAFKELNDNDIVMVCTGNHPGGSNVLYRSASIIWAATDSDIYKRGMAESKE